MMDSLQSFEIQSNTLSILPFYINEVGEAIEKTLPVILSHINKGEKVSDCILAIVDKIERIGETEFVVAMPEPGMPIMGLAGEEGTSMLLENWILYGTTLHKDNQYQVFMMTIDVTRRPYLDGGWKINQIAYYPIKKSLNKYLTELEEERISIQTF